MRRTALRLLIALISIVALIIGGFVGSIYLAFKRGEQITRQFGHLVGQPSAALARDFRAPDRVERIAPFAYHRATGQVATRADPYVVWTYDLLPGVPGNWHLRVLIDDRTDQITRFRGVLD